MEAKQNPHNNPQINYPYYQNTNFIITNPNPNINNNPNLKTPFPGQYSFQNFNNPMFFQQSSHIPPQFLNNYKAYYNPIIYHTYLNGGYQINNGGKGVYPLQQINNHNISSFFASPYTISYNSNKPGQIPNPNPNGMINIPNNQMNNNFLRKNNYSNNQYSYNNNNRYREDRSESVKKSATEILNIESKVLDDPAEIEKWVLSRKRNFPSERNIHEKQEKGKIKENSGMLSTLEMTLRDRLKIMSQIDKKKFVRRRTFKRRRSKRNKKGKNSEIEQGEIKQEIEENNYSTNNVKEDTNEAKNTEGGFKANTNNIFKYRKNKIYDNMIKNEKIKEMNVILQCFRYFVNEGLV